MIEDEESLVLQEQERILYLRPNILTVRLRGGYFGGRRVGGSCNDFILEGLENSVILPFSLILSWSFQFGFQYFKSNSRKPLILFRI